MKKPAPTIDPITLEVVRNKLDGISEEMEMTLLRSSFSPIVKEGLDASASLFTINAETLAQATATPIHLATLIPIAETLLKTFPLSEMREGDIYIMNDPYLGGTHLPDIGLVMPVFFGGVPIALTAAMTHHQDVGGMTAGSVPTNATEIFQEGIRIPPLRLCRDGVFDETLLSILRRNVRVPDEFIGDLMAQVAACKIGARRLVELAASIGSDDLASIFDELLHRSEVMTREALASISPGRYSFEGYLDNDGIDLDRQILIAADITIGNGTMHCDFSRSSDQVRGPFNAVQSGSRAAAYFAVRAITDPSIPTNGGCFRPVSITVRPGSVLDPVEPAPVGCRTATIKRVANTIFGALRTVALDRLGAENAGEMLMVAFGGTRADDTRYVVGEMIASSSAAYDGRDGVDGIETDTSNCMNMPVEALESEAPIRVRRLEVDPDSGGPGKFRGGLGVVKEFEILEGSVTVTHRGERHSSQAKGAVGGGEGKRAHSAIFRSDGEIQEIASKLVTTLKSGDRLVVRTAGSGGFGDPKERDRKLVALDLQDGKITESQAYQAYALKK